MQFAEGKLPPLNPVPEPRVTTAVRVAFASLSTSLICDVDSANTTHPGISCNAAVPSNEYGIKSSWLVRTFFSPTIRRKSAIMLWASCISSTQLAVVAGKGQGNWRCRHLPTVTGSLRPHKSCSESLPAWFAAARDHPPILHCLRPVLCSTAVLLRSL